MGTPRSRSDSTVTVGATFLNEGGTYNGTSKDLSVYTYQSGLKTELDDTYDLTMDDVVTPDFKKRIANGEIINNPMYKREVWITYPKLTPFIRDTIGSDSNGFLYGGFWNGQNVTSMSYYGAVLEASQACLDAENTKKSLAVTQAHSNASSNEISALATLAEGQKSVVSIGQILYRVMKIARAARKLDLAYLRKELTFKEQTDRYMELRYALRPLMIDARQVVKAVEESKEFKTVRATARGFASHTYDDSISWSDLSEGSFTYNKVKTIKRVTDIRAGVLSELKTSPVSVWGLDQPLEAIWEIVPFSFIIDWFLNIGDTIAAWTPNAGVKELASWVSVKTTEAAEIKLTNFKNVDPSGAYDVRNTFTWSGSYSELVHVSKREVNPSLSYYPGSKIRLDTLKLLDLTVIIRGLLGKR